MKVKKLLKNVAFITTMISTMVYAQVPAGQEKIVIPSGNANAGLLETTINGDVDGSGNRINPNRIYELAEGWHIVFSAINVTNDTGTIKIVGATTGKKPVIIPVVNGGIAPGQNVINGNLELRNLHIQGRNDQGGLYGGHIFKVIGNDRSLVVEDCLLELANRCFHLQNVPQGLTMEFRNNYFRDLFTDSQQWAGNAINAKTVPIESLIFENNTVTGGGLSLLLQSQMIRYALINHNSFINTSTYWNLNPYFYEAYVTSNLFYNSNIIGEDINMRDSNPDKRTLGMIALDTIDIKIGKKGIPAYAMNADQTAVIAPYNDVSNYKIYYADNINFTEATMNDYNNGVYNALQPNPISYLNWSGVNGPHPVAVPPTWMGQREIDLFADHAGIIEENNILNQDPLLATEAISAADAVPLASYLRRMYSVPGEPVSDMSGYTFGDFDPTTIPGIGTEDGDGITKFADLIEDFSIGSAFKSNIDGLSIGALHWTSEIDSYDPVQGLADIMSAYNTSLSVDDFGLNNVFGLKGYPNPSNSEAIIQFDMPSGSNVKISVYNILGAHITTLVDNESYGAGAHSVKWNTSNINSGLYFLKLEAGNSSQTLKMMVAH
jgi:hypothetical protein